MFSLLDAVRSLCFFHSLKRSPTLLLCSQGDGRIGFVETVDHNPVFGIDDCFFYKPSLGKFFFKDSAFFQTFLPVLDPAFVVPGGTVGVDGVPVDAKPSVVLLNQSA